MKKLLVKMSVKLTPSVDVEDFAPPWPPPCSEDSSLDPLSRLDRGLKLKKYQNVTIERGTDTTYVDRWKQSKNGSINGDLSRNLLHILCKWKIFQGPFKILT